MYIGSSISTPRNSIFGEFRRRVGIHDFRKICLGQKCVVGDLDGTIAFDGEKEVEISTGDQVEIALLQDGPWIANVEDVMRCIGKAGLLSERR